MRFGPARRRQLRCAGPGLLGEIRERTLAVPFEVMPDEGIHQALAWYGGRRMRRWNSTVLAHAALSLALLGGCAKSYLTVSFKPPAAAESPAEVVGTPGFAELQPSIRIVALRAPAACLEEVGAPRSGSGVAARGRAIVETRCTTVLGELERALAARYRVIGWREVAEEEKEARTVLLPAKRPVDVLLEVTDLYPMPILVDDLDGPAVVIRDADPDGAAIGPKALSEGGDRFVREFLKDRYRDGALAGVEIRLEVVAVSGRTGEPIWRYRRRIVDDLQGTRDARLLMRGRSDVWRPVVPRGGGEAHAAPGSGEESPVQRRLRGLAFALANDLTTRLSAAP